MGAQKKFAEVHTDGLFAGVKPFAVCRTPRVAIEYRENGFETGDTWLRNTVDIQGDAPEVGGSSYIYSKVESSACIFWLG